MIDDPAGEPTLDPDDLARGLEAGSRFRCDQCGNVTRFDVEATERTRRFLHFDLGGDSRVDEEEVLLREVVSVTCRWCGRDDAIRVEVAPTAAVDTAAPS
jgi:RNase P subunit RPR2